MIRQTISVVFVMSMSDILFPFEKFSLYVESNDFAVETYCNKSISTF